MDEQKQPQQTTVPPVKTNPPLELDFEHDRDLRVSETQYVRLHE